MDKTWKPSFKDLPDKLFMPAALFTLQFFKGFKIELAWIDPSQTCYYSDILHIWYQIICIWNVFNQFMGRGYL